MDRLELISNLSIEGESKIVFFVIDGLGGLPCDNGRETELSEAHTPNLDALARGSICGLIDPISPGIIPGSGPAHLSLFGYDPFQYEIGRGVLGALGIGFPLEPEDVVARGNFATLDEKGIIVDRRAGRISTTRNRELCKLLDGMEIERVKIFVKPIKEHRISVIFRGEGLEEDVTDSDPQKVGSFPLVVRPKGKGAEKTASIVNRFLSRSQEVLKDFFPTNVILLRGFSRHVRFPLFDEVYKVKAAAIAAYPMYQGIARLLGMRVFPCGEEVEDVISVLREHYENFDFFYIHVKTPDSLGEDGNFRGRVEFFERIDKALPSLLELRPDVLVVTGDHSTPARLRSHSWHPVPFLLHSAVCRVDEVQRFSELECARGELGRFSALNVMALVLSNSGRLKKFGA
jgi:2,3-bisphosphoglycerate-independent phosphoglycerate mutase